MSFGRKVQELRKSHDLSQTDLGKIIGISIKHLSKVENDKLLPHSLTIKKMAEYFKVSVDYLLFDDVPKNIDPSKFNDAELVDLMHQSEDLPQEDRATAKNVIKALITKNKAENIFK